MRFTLCVWMGLLALAAWATPEPGADSLDQAADELDAIATQLDDAQAQARSLKAKLAELDALAADHRQSLEHQAELQAQYDQTVAALEAHDRAALDLAADLKAQLATERRLTAWRVPLAATAVCAAAVEGWLLSRQ